MKRFFVVALPLVMAAAIALPTRADTRAGASAATAPPPEKITSVEGITEYRLANGLRVLLFPDPSKQTATVNITYLVGSRHENYGETGMAHLLEHLVFKGTPTHPNVPQELTAHGARPNGTTDYDRTNYFETFDASDENLDWALDLEASRMVSSFIAKKDLDSEMSVVRNEFEMGENQPGSVLWERVMSTSYLWHNYGKSVIGARADIENVPIDRLQAFYRQWYQPDNAILVVAGKIDEAKTLNLIRAKFGAIPRPTRVLPVTYTAEPVQDGERTVTLRRVGDMQMIGAAYHIPAGSHEDYAALDILAFILGDAPAGRLHKALVETKKAARVSTDTLALKEPGVLFASADVRLESSLDDARDALLKVIDAAANAPITAEEFNRARDNRLKNWELGMRDSQRLALQLSEWAALGDWRLMFVYRDRIKNATADDVRRVAATYLKPSNRTLGLFVPTTAPERSTIPATPDVAGLVKDYKGGEALSQGEAFDPTPAAIEARVARAKLSTPLKLVLVPKKTRGGTVQVGVTLHMGDEQNLKGLARTGELTAAMLMRGTTKHTRQQIKDEFDRLKAQPSVFGDSTQVTAGFETTRESLEPALRLLAEVVREPAFPSTELDQLKQEELARIEDAKSDPIQKASTTMRRHLNPWPKDDPRYAATPEELVEMTQAVTVEAVKSFHADYYGATAGEVVLVGDFDAEAMKKMAGELFAGWTNKKPFTRIVTTYRERPAIDQIIETPDKESAVFIAGLPVDMRDDDPDYPAVVLGNFMTGGGFLNSRLAKRIRQTEGLSYGVSSSFNASPFEKNGMFQAFAIYAPQNAEKLKAAYQEEIAKMLADGFSDEELAEAKKGWLQSRQVSRSNDRELTRTLAQREFQGRTLLWDAEFEKNAGGLSKEQIHAAMKKYIAPGKMSMVQAGDFAKAKMVAGPAAK